MFKNFSGAFGDFHHIAALKLGLGQGGIIGEGIGYLTHGVYLFQKNLSKLLNVGFMIGLRGVIITLKTLHGKAHGRQGVFDFMGDLSGHLLPRLVFGRLG